MENEWQQAWSTSYDNCSDERWKTKSLNPMQSEQYSIPLCKPVSRPAPSKDSGQKKEKEPQKQRESLRLPQPKMSKINKTMFCISLQTEIHLFYFVTDPEEKAKMKPKRLFSVIAHSIGEKIEFVTGNNSNLIMVGTQNSLIILEVTQNEGEKKQIKQKLTKNIPQLRTLITLASRLIAVSVTHIFEFEVAEQIVEISARKIEFRRKEDEDIFAQLNPVGIVIGSGQSLFYFGSKKQEKIDTSKLKGAPGQQPTKATSEALTIVKFKIEGSSKIEGVKARLYPVDHIFELDIFTRTKIYEIQRQTFLMSLHEEVILIKENFDHYIVWDNVSVVSSKSQSKKGQLVLVDKKIMVFSENKEIYAHEIFYDDHYSKLSMPPIDSFKSNEEDDQVLYDSLMLEHNGFMKVLTYIKPTTVVYPTNETNERKLNDPKAKDAAQNLTFTMVCISQSDPKDKLEQLFTQNKSPQDIETFCQRFKISKELKTKCSWNVSAKELKDIEGILMEIADDEYIQTQLDNILKKTSHNLDFLNSVEVKQISRLRRLLVTRICRLASDGPADEHKQPEYIFAIIQWLMESIMFKEKVSYSKQFLSFKEYDFIEIGKLKAASLKEEIKLLSCKKYEKRLKYFLNAFKILVIANYEEVFSFLLLDKNEQEIEDFIKEFRFILPHFEETSTVFIKQRDYGIFDKTKAIKSDLSPSTNRQDRNRHMSFAQKSDNFVTVAPTRREKEKESDVNETKEKEDKCLLWEPLDQSKQIAETMEEFQSGIITDIMGSKQVQSEDQRMAAVDKSKQLLQEFQSRPWFTSAAFKQHSMITKTTRQIHDQFKELKRKGVFKILIRFLYNKMFEAEKLSKGAGAQVEERVNQMLQKFIQADFIPQSFKRNVDARVLVYRNLLQRKNASEGKKVVHIELPLLEEFVTQGEPEYFDFLFRNIRNQILNEVKDIYDNISVGFFRQRFQLFLQSALITPDDIISFLDQFSGNVTADDIRIDVFCTIKRLLRLSDRVNTKCYIEKCMDMEVLPERDVIQSGKLREEAKIPYGYYFYHFFRVFRLDYTYEQFIGFTSTLIQDNAIIQQLVSRYCRGDYELTQDRDHNLACEVQFEEVGIHEKIDSVDIHQQPLQFFGLLLHLLDVMDFQIEEKDVFELMMEDYLNEHKFDQLHDFIRKLKEYHVTEYNLHTKNYQMISDFKDEIDIQEFFIEYVLAWVKNSYQSIQTLDHLNEKLGSVEQAITMVQKFTKNHTEVRKEKSLYDLLTNIRVFEPSLILNVEDIKQEAVCNSSFIFLMHIFKRIGVERLASCGEEENEAGKVMNLSRIFESHKDYTQLEKVDMTHPEFIRFLVEVCLQMIEQHQFPMARHLILTKIPSDKYYFKDALLVFLAAADREERRAREYKDNIIAQILPHENTSLLKNNLAALIDNYSIAGFIGTTKKQPKPEMMFANLFQKTEPADLQLGEELLKAELEVNKVEFVRRCKDMFDSIISKHRKDDAFFFLVRVKVLPNNAVLEIVRRYKSHLSDQYDKLRQTIEYQCYFLVVAYLKALQSFIQKEFYPAFAFFESKMNILLDPKERKDMIKDINIALSKLEKHHSNKDTQQLEATRQELKAEYLAYMNLIGQDANIKLADEDSNLATRKVDIYTRKVTKDMFEEEANQEIEYKKDLHKNIEKVQQVQEDNRLNVLNREVTERITEIKKANERHALLEAQTKKETKQASVAQKKAREIEEIRRKEKEEIESIKDTYQSNTTKRVNDLIDNLRKKRQTVQAMRVAPTSSIRDEPISKAPVLNNGQPSIKVKGPQELQSPKSELNSEHLLPITMRAKTDNKMGREETGENKFQLVQLQKKMFPQTPFDPMTLKKKTANFDDVSKLYKEQQSAQALKCIQKFDMLKNPQVRTELIKRAYSVTNNLSNLIEFLKFLISFDGSWKESIEEKSLGIAAQMIKMKEKEKLNIKEIIPAEFFTAISKATIKDYYGIAYEILKPSLKKIFEKELMPVHAIGILFRYSLGSENKFYSKVMHEYFKVLVKNYELKTYDDKELGALAEKLKSNYASLPDSKDHVFEQLINSVSNAAKKARLLEVLKRTVERGGQSVMGGQSNKDIAFILQRIMK